MARLSIIAAHIQHQPFKIHQWCFYVYPMGLEPVASG